MARAALPDRETAPRWSPRAVVPRVAIAVLASLIGTLLAASAAISLGLPSIPSSAISTPKAAIAPSSGSLTAPTVSLQSSTTTLSAEVSATTVSAPTITATAPSVSTTVSSGSASVTTSTPAAPTVSSSSPTASVKVDSGSLKTSAGSASTPSASATTPSVKPTSAPLAGAPAAGAPAPGGSAPSGGSSASGAGAAGGGLAPLGSYGSARRGYASVPAPEGPLTAAARALIARRERILKALVARHRSCLEVLPDAQRRLLELRTGAGRARPLGPRATAVRLHVDRARLARLERRAVHELLDAARTHSCGEASRIAAGVASFIAKLGRSDGGAAGAVDAVSYRAPSRAGASATPSRGGGVLGAELPPLASDVILILLLLAAVGVVVTLVIADAAGQGPRHAEWRQRVIDRVRTLR